MRILLIVIITLLSLTHIIAQNFNAKPVKGLPSDEVYDLLADSKGFLWAAHSLGVSRFDGANFKDFNNPYATGLGMTDLVEDKEGRIWCHNFSGQIFYIENETMFLLKEYNNKEQSFYPRMAILGDELLATTKKGIFICNTKNLQCKYLNNNITNGLQRSFSIIGEVAYIYDSEKWTCYSKKNGLKEIFFLNKTNTLFKSGENPLQFQPIKTADTLYANLMQSFIYKFISHNDTISLVAVEKQQNFVNTIIKAKKNIWINTRKESHTNDNRLKIEGYNLTDVAEDKDGNIWYSSLEKGLFVEPKNIFWRETIKKDILYNDNIRHCLLDNKRLIIGTQKGSINIEDAVSKKILTKFKLPKTAGSIEHIFKFSEDEILVAPSVGIYLINTQTNTVYQLNNHLTIKDIQIIKDTLTLGSTSYIVNIKIPEKYDAIKLAADYKNKYINNLIKEIEHGKGLIYNRLNSVSINPISNNILVGFSDGIYEFKDNKIIPILYKNKPVVGVLTTVKNKVVATTINGGIYLFNSNGIRKITVEDGLISNTILHAKAIDDQLFLIEPNCIQVLDIKTEKIIQTTALPSVKAANIYDIWKEDSSVYISTNKTIYAIQLKDIFKSIIPVNYLLSTIVDSGFISTKKEIILPYQKNNIEFNIVSPSFNYPENTYFKYRLITGNDFKWQETKTNTSNITFASLKPGSYTFEAYAVNFQNNNAKPIIISFQILKPWWQKWWFLTIVILCVLALAYYIIIMYLKALQKSNDQKLEKLNLKSQLRKSQLSTIIAQMNPHFIFNTLNAIQSLIYKNDKNRATIYIGKFSELVRNILDNSHLQEITLREEIDQLNLYLDLEKIRFENDLNISIEIDNDLDKDNILIPPILIQPFVENAIAHGLFHKKGDKNLIIKFKKAKVTDYIEIIINDNGIGRENSNKINLERKKHNSFAVPAIKKRISLINQTLKKQIDIQIFDNKDENDTPIGTTIILSIPINQEQLFMH